jgi:hypothetical protein
VSGVRQLRNGQGQDGSEVTMRWRIAVIGVPALCAPWAVLAAGHPETAGDWIETPLVNWGPMIS